MKIKVILPVLFASLLIIPASLFAQEVPDFVEYIDIGNSTLHVKIHEDLAYVTNPTDGQIVVLNTTSNHIVDIFDVVQGVTFIEIVIAQNRIYASADGQPKIFVYDLTTGSKITEINFPTEETTLFSKSDKPYDQLEYMSFQTSGISLAYNPNNGLLYAVHSEANHVDVINTKTDTIIEKIPVGKNPLFIEIDANRKVGYVTNGQSNDVTVLDLHNNKVIRSIQTGLVPDQMVMVPEDRRLFVTHHESSHVAVIDLRNQTLIDKIQLKGPTNAIGYDSQNNLVHVTYTPESDVTGMASTHIVAVIDPSTLQHVANFEIKSNPFTMDIDSDEKKLFATIIGDGQVISVDLSNDDLYQKIVVPSPKTTPEDSSQASGGGCLIATAAFGSELAPQVQMLRELRDNSVLSTSSGTIFMTKFNQIYYSFSPTVADWERENPFFQETVKTLITPMISTLSIMSLAQEGSEYQIVGLGISIIALNLGMYFVVPAVAIIKIREWFKRI